MDNTIIYFIIALVIPPLYYRLMYLIYPKYFNVQFIKKRTGLSIHHMNYGVIYILIATFLLLFNGYNIYTIILLGFGLGFMLDEFAPATLIKMNRKDEMKIYAKAQLATLIIFLMIIIFLLILTSIL